MEKQVQNEKISHLLDKLNLRSPSDTGVGMLAEQAAECPYVSTGLTLFTLFLKLKKKNPLSVFALCSGVFWLNFPSSSILLINSTIAVFCVFEGGEKNENSFSFRKISDRYKNRENSTINLHGPNTWFQQ